MVGMCRFYLWFTIGELRFAWPPRDTMEVRSVIVAHLTVACGVGQSLWCLCGERTCLCLRVHVGNVIVRRLTRLLNITRSTNRY